MQITKVEVFQIDVPLKEPFIISYHRFETMPAVIIKIDTEEGITGYRESVPDEHVTGESVYSVREALKHQLVPAILHTDPTNIQQIHQKMNRALVSNGAAKAAIDIACYDILGKQANLPVYKLLGGRKEAPLTIPRVLSIFEPEVLAKQAIEAVNDGYDELKMKLGTTPEEDVARVKAVREAIGPEVLIRVDVNQGWGTVQTARHTMKQLEPYDVTWVEQPIRQMDVSLFKRLKERVAQPLMADESMVNAQNLRTLIEDESVDYINIKLMKSGGIYPAYQLATQAELFGIACQVGSMVETSVASAAGFHVAAAKDNIISTEISGPTKFTEEVGDLSYELPFVNLPDKAGLGIEVDETQLHKLMMSHESITSEGTGS